MEVAPDVHQIRHNQPNNPRSWVFSYLITGSDGAAMVDCGWNFKESFDEMAQQVEEAGARIDDIRTLVMTHLHPDHYGLAGTLKEKTGCQVIFHELEKPFVETRYRSYSKLLDEMADWLQSYGTPEEEIPELQTASVQFRRFVAEVDADQVIVGGEHLRLGDHEWEVIHTPGHTRGHVVLFNRTTGTIITGDHVLPRITPNISLNPQSSENPLGDYLASLRKIIDLPADVVCPGHKEAFQGLAKRIRGIEEHHEDRLGQMLASLSDTPKTGYQVAADVRWNPGAFAGFDKWSRRAAMMETLAHLEYLRRQGRVEKLLKDDVYHYRRH